MVKQLLSDHSSSGSKPAGYIFITMPFFNAYIVKQVKILKKSKQSLHRSDSPVVKHSLSDQLSSGSKPAGNIFQIHFFYQSYDPMTDLISNLSLHSPRM